MHHHHKHKKELQTNYKAISKIFFLGIVLNFLYVIVELVSGLYFRSLALVSDAIHNLSDVLGLGVSWLGFYLSHRKATWKRTFGLKKASIIAALVNSIVIFIISGGIIVESFERLLYESKPVHTDGIFAVALAGIVINFGTAALFYTYEKVDINLKSAFLHLLADGFLTIAVIISAAIISFTKQYWIDPAISLLIVAVILWNAWGIFYESLNLMMDAVPGNVDIHEIYKFLSGLPEVVDVHDLHIWAMSSTETALTVHIVRSRHHDNEEVLETIQKEMEEKYRISHITVQFENQVKGKFCKNCLHQEMLKN